MKNARTTISISLAGPPLTANAIANRIGRSPKGVTEAIARLKIDPVFTSSGRTFYDPKVTETLSSSMRKANRQR